MTDREPTPADSYSVSGAMDDPDSFGKWVVRGIAIGIGLLIVEIPLALIAIWWVNHQFSKIRL